MLVDPSLFHHLHQSSDVQLSKGAFASSPPMPLQHFEPEHEARQCFYACLCSVQCKHRRMMVDSCLRPSPPISMIKAAMINIVQGNAFKGMG